MKRISKFFDRLESLPAADAIGAFCCLFMIVSFYLIIYLAV